MLQYNDMTVFAIFKYSPDKPALRVHIWDIFENANLETVDFNQFFDSVYDQLLEVYEDNGFDEELASEVKGVGNGANFWPYVLRPQPIRWLTIRENRLNTLRQLSQALTAIAAFNLLQ